jgi:hypothetical protein
MTFLIRLGYSYTCLVATVADTSITFQIVYIFCCFKMYVNQHDIKNFEFKFQFNFLKSKKKIKRAPARVIISNVRPQPHPVSNKRYAFISSQTTCFLPFFFFSVEAKFIHTYKVTNIKYQVDFIVSTVALKYI